MIYMMPALCSAHAYSEAPFGIEHVCAASRHRRMCIMCMFSCTFVSYLIAAVSLPTARRARQNEDKLHTTYITNVQRFVAAVTMITTHTS